MTEFANNKNKKSRNEIMRSALGSYLKQRNYMANDRYRKSDLVLTQTTEQVVMNSTIKNDIARPNSFLYSSVFCLNNNTAQVDQQFSKLIDFIRIQKGDVKIELNNMIPALLCHLYIEMLKGRDWRLSIEFLRKYAVLIGPIDVVSSSSQQQSKANGSSDENLTSEPSAAVPNQVINFIEVSDTPTQAAQSTTTPSSSAANSTNENFKSIIHQLSQMKQLQDIENSDNVINFRSCKYNILMSTKAINILQNYLSKHSHVLILQIIHNWFNIETSDDAGLAKNQDNSDNDEDNFNDDNIQDFILTNGYTSRLVHYKLQQYNNNNEKEAGCEDLEIEEEVEAEEEVECDCEESENEDCEVGEDYATRLRNCVERLQQYQVPIRVFNISNSDKSLTSSNLDPECCHLVSGFNDSTLRIWPLNRSIHMGRKPFQSTQDRLCKWNITHCEDDSSSDDDIEEPVDHNMPFGKKITRGERKLKFLESTNYEHIFTDSGGYTFRGHSKDVTDVLFSKDNNLIFSVSKDLTMRAWKANDYSCACVYRGHNYPIWCVTESSTKNYLATGSKDSTAKLWCSERRFPVQVYAGHTQDVDAVAFHPNGSYLATGSTDLSIRLWCVTSGQPARIFTNCQLPVTTIKFSPDGKYLAAGGEEQSIRVFDIATSSQILELNYVGAATSGVTSLDWSSDSQRLASTHTTGEVKIWNVSTIHSTNENAPEETKLLIESYESGCSKVVKVRFNNEIDGYSLSCIGEK